MADIFQKPVKFENKLCKFVASSVAWSAEAIIILLRRIPEQISRRMFVFAAQTVTWLQYNYFHFFTLFGNWWHEPDLLYFHVCFYFGSECFQIKWNNWNIWNIQSNLIYFIESIKKITYNVHLPNTSQRKLCYSRIKREKKFSLQFDTIKDWKINHN